MKILVVSNYYPPHFIGGYEIACADTVNLLRKSGHDCLVLTSEFDSGRTGAAEEHQVHRKLQLHRVWGTYSFSETKLHNEAETKKILGTFKPDIVYFWNLYGLTLSPVTAVKERKIPATVHLMDLMLKIYERSPRKLLSRWLRKTDVELVRLRDYFDNHIAISEFVSGMFGNLRAKNSAVIRPFLDFSVPFSKKESYRPHAPFRGVYVGQIEPHKGVQPLCEAVRRLNEESGIALKLDIYGRSSCGLDQKIEERFGDHVEIHRNRSRDEILATLPEYDVGFFPSIWEEPFGIAQIELMRAGLPVITSGRGGSREALTPENALLFRNNDVDDLHRKLCGLLERYDDLAPVIGRNAATHTAAHFNEKVYLAAVEQHLLSVAGE